MPNRAWLDNRLSKLHLRVLGIVAMHARFGSNHLGCTLSCRGISEKIEVRHDKVAAARRELVELGYLEEHPHPTKKQMYMHFIVFDNDADADAIGNKTGPVEVSGSEAKPDPYEGPVENQTGPIQGSGSTKTGPAEGSYKILSSKEREDIGLKPKKDIPNLIGNSPVGEPHTEQGNGQTIGAQLAQFERDMQSMFDDCTPCGLDLNLLRFHYEWLTEIADEYGSHHGDPIGGWAERLSGEVNSVIEALEEDMEYPDDQQEAYQ